MYRRVLVPIDTSGRGEAALKGALPLVAPGGTIHLLHVIERVAGIEDAEMAEFYEMLRVRADEALDRAARSAEDEGLELRGEVVVGKRALEIVRYAQAEACDLIVLISHAATPDQPGWGVGTVSHQVALTAPCSVLLMR